MGFFFFTGRSVARPGPFRPCYMWRWLRLPPDLEKENLQQPGGKCATEKDDDTLRRARSIELRKIKRYNDAEREWKK